MTVSNRSRLTLAKAVFIALALSGGFATCASAAPSDLDTGFGTGGKVLTSIIGDEDEISAVAVQSDGKIVVAGRSIVALLFDFALARYNTDGSLDASFDSDGKVVTHFGGDHDFATAIALQTDGKIVVAGDRENGGSADFALARYNADGSLDSSFDGDGKLTTAIGAGHDEANALAIQPDGKIVVAGASTNGAEDDFALARYNADGSLDNSFDGNGKLITAISPGNDKVKGVAVQPDGKIVVAGYSSVGLTFDIALARYNSNGSLDPGFDGDGKQSTSFGDGFEEASAVAVQTDGRLVVAGTSSIGGDYDFVLARFNADGSLDSAFDGDGKQSTAIGGATDHAFAMAIQQNGKIVVSGDSFNGLNNDIAVARYTADGSPDSGFDGDGKLTTAIGASHESAYGVAVQSDGKIVTGGYSDNGSANEFALTRYLGDPPPFVPVAPLAPTATIAKPKSGKVKSRKLKAFSGTAGPAGQVAKVEIALLKVNRKLRKRGYCRWLRSARSVFKKVRDKTRKCAKPRFLAAKGADNWSFKLKHRLPKGSYKLFVRVTLADGQRHTAFTASQGNLRRFRVT